MIVIRVYLIGFEFLTVSRRSEAWQQGVLGSYLIRIITSTHSKCIRSKALSIGYTKEDSGNRCIYATRSLSERTNSTFKQTTYSSHWLSSEAGLPTQTLPLATQNLCVKGAYDRFTDFGRGITGMQDALATNL